MRQAVAAEASRAAPPVALTAAMAVTDITLNQWVAVATLGYILVQAGYLIWKWYRELQAGRAADAAKLRADLLNTIGEK